MFQWIVEKILQGKRLAVATVIDRSGSGPREPGAMMARVLGGPARGTVGGGILEVRTQAAAETVLRGGPSRMLRFDLSAPELSEGGMVCGGRVEILVAGLDRTDPDQARIFAKLGECLDTGRRVYLLTSMRRHGDEDEVEPGFGLVDGDNVDWGSLDERFRDLAQIQGLRQADGPTLIEDKTARCFIQPVDPRARVYIAGAGHVGSALAGLCSLLTYPFVVIDDRDDFADRRRFPGADDVVQTASYADAFGRHTVRAPDAIVIATHSHRFDGDVLAQALRTPAGYIGMIASRRKRDIIYDALVKRGFGREALARVHSPIGLDIGAKTPAEIAVSIVAQLIALRNGPR